MSVYYKQNFTSPESVFVLVKEELKSYMETGAADDALFPIWANECLNKLGKSSFPINQAMLCIDNYQATLPDDFHAAREVWSCSEYQTFYQLPSSTYTQISTRLDTPDLYCDVDCTVPDIIQAIYKTTNTVAFSWKKSELLTPGNHYPSCPEDMYCANRNAISPSSYDIRDNKISTSFESGKIYIQYYSNQSEKDLQLIPNTYRTKKFIELFLKEKVFEQLKNQATDDTKEAMKREYLYYKSLADEAYILAEIEIKSEDVYRKFRAIKRTRNRFRKYDIR